MLVVIVKSIPPDVDVANVCEATLLPLSEVIVPPAPPASVPQKNCPVVVEYRSFSVDRLHDVRPAPARVFEKYPLVDVALVMNAEVEYRLFVEKPVEEARARVVWPVMYALPDTDRLVDDALVRVVLPVTFNVEENTPVVPTIAPYIVAADIPPVDEALDRYV